MRIEIAGQQNQNQFKRRMDINDFKNNRRYKFIIPFIYVISWTLMLFGPVYFPVLYQKYCIFWLVYVDMKIIMMLASMLFVLISFCRTIKKSDKLSFCQEQMKKSFYEKEIYYAFIIPNYKEDEEMLQQTLDVLASHSRAQQSYLVFLAMEKHEDGSQQKAENLLVSNSQKFKIINYTLHQIQLNQQKGKASNVSWCAEHLEQLLPTFINLDSVMITVIDADSWAPDLYIDLVHEHLQTNYRNKDQYIYQPPQIFTRNNMEVPVVTRVQDLMHSYGHCSNLYSIFNMTFPLSNYSLSLSLAKKIGFWDTCADAIGEDFHTTQKAYWKTHGEIITVPIYVPFNQLNIQTDRGYFGDIYARFWQSERHAQGVSDVAYEFKMLFSQKFRLKNFLVVYLIIEVFALTALMPWIFISMFLQSKLLFFNDYPEDLVPEYIVNIFYQIMWIGGSLGYFIYEVLKRYANLTLYKQKNESILRIFEYIVFIPINLFAINMTTFTISAFFSQFGNSEYIVAEKKNRSSLRSTNSSIG